LLLLPLPTITLKKMTYAMIYKINLILHPYHFIFKSH
jgi:hypothetical protein